MILVWLIAIPIAGGMMAWACERRSVRLARWISLGALAAPLAVGSMLWARGAQVADLDRHIPWLAEAQWAWIPRFGVSVHLAADGLSLLMVLLTLFLGIAALVASWTEIRIRVGFFHFSLLWALAGVIGVFLAVDLFLFYFFWEMMLIPMYFLIGVWGHERRIHAAIKFFIFTQLSGLLMLVAILGLVFLHHRDTGLLTFDYLRLLGTPIDRSTAMWLMLGFLAAFAVKLPAVPLHTWLPDAHAEAPTGGSVILAGLLLKTGAYGLLRFAVPLFPGAAREIAPVAMVLGTAGILYGAVLAFAQTDLKRLVAYTSVSHLGFVLLGVFAWNKLALQGAVMQMICHGLSTGALFILAGALYERAHTRDVRRMGGLWSITPRMGAMALFFAMASLGLPGLGNFIGEFLVLLGAYQVSVAITAVAAVGLVAATIYALALMQRAFYGPNVEKWALADLSAREVAVLAALAGSLIWLGLYPQPVLNIADPALEALYRLGGGAFTTPYRVPVQ
jgi:NADH-quinone oxidoreductase subunit M